MKKVDLLVFSIFLFLGFLVKLSSMFQSNLGWDESLYLLVASRLVEGHPPYTVIWDNKPPGIYLLFSLALMLLGHSIVSIHILACLAITLSCYLLYKIGKVFGKNDSLMGFLAGILYLIYSVKIEGIINGNTEIFFTPFLLVAFYLFFREINNSENLARPSTLFKIGLAFGIASQIKQVVIFDFLALIIFYLHTSLVLQKEQGIKYSLKRLLKLSIPLISGLILPSLVILFYFIINGHFYDYLVANLSANLSRIHNVSFPITFLVRVFKEQIVISFLLWLCLFLSPFYIVFIKDEQQDRRNLIYLIIWFCMTLISIILLSPAYSHYYLQLLPPLCLISSYLIRKTIWRSSKSEIKREFIILTIILLPQFLSSTFPYIKQNAKFVYFRLVKGMDSWGEDDITLTSKYLQKRVDKEDYIYVVDLPVSIYFLVNAKVPSKYAFPSFLNDKQLQKIPGINSLQELDAIMSKKPIYVIKSKIIEPVSATNPRDDEFYNNVNIYLQKDYSLEKQVGDIQLYRLKEKKNMINKESQQ